MYRILSEEAEETKKNKNNIPDGRYYSITTIEELKALCNKLDAVDIFAADTETSGTDELDCKLYGISISPVEKEGYYIPLSIELEKFSQTNLIENVGNYLPLEIVRQYLRPYFESDKVKIFHNLVFDLHVLKRHGMDIKPPFYDTMISSWIVGNYHGAKFGLKHLAEEKLGFKMLEFKEVAGKKPFYQVPIDLATFYASSDTDMALRLHNKVEPFYEKVPSLKATKELEFRLIPILQSMEAIGVHIDVNHLEELKKPTQDKIKILSKEIYSSAKRYFNINSDDQLLVVLNNIIPGTKLFNTQASTLEMFKNEHPIFEKVLEYRTHTKLLTTYINGILNKLRYNKLHTSFRQHGITTGRLASSGPNLQNIPVRTKEGEEIRRAFIPEYGRNWVCIDYSQLEIRVVAHISQDKTWIDALNDGADIHQATADLVGVSRKAAKAINFGLVYGITEFGLSKRIDMSVNDTRDFINLYFSKLPGVKRYVDQHRKYALEQCYVETMFGRRRYFKYRKDHKAAVEAVQREGINAPVQGSAADIVKMAMIEVDKYLKDSNSRSNMLLQVHDELDFEIYEEDMEKDIKPIVDIMSNVTKLSVPLTVDVEYGKNWADIKKWEN